MGADHSKIDSATIKTNVQNLKKKIKQENAVIDSYLSIQINSALDIYSEELRKTKGNEDLIKEIWDVKKMLQLIPTQKGESVRYFKIDWDQQLEDLEKRVKQLRICREFDKQQRENELKEIIKLSKKFDQASKGKQHVKVKEGKKQIPHCFLELFLDLPPSVINSNNEFERDIKPTLFDYDRIENEMKGIKAKVEQPHENLIQELKTQIHILKTTGSTQNVKFEENVTRDSGKLLQNNVISSKNPNNKNRLSQFFVPIVQEENNKIENVNSCNKKKAEELLKLIDNAVKIQEETAQTFIVSINRTEYEKRKNQLINLKKQLQKVSDETKEIKDQKDVISTRITNTLQVLEENARQNNHKLIVSGIQKNTENKLNNNNDDRSKFDKTLKLPFGYVSNEIITEKHRTEEKKEKDNIWSIKDALDKHIMVNKNLQGLEAYKQDRNEILILQQRLNNLAEDLLDEKMKENLLRIVKERLKMLDQKIIEEQEVIKCMWYQNEDNWNPGKQEEINRYLQYLQTIENNIDGVTKLNLAATQKIKSVEELKKKITDLQLLNSDINNKRITVLRKINKVIDQLRNEEDYYEKIKKIKSTLLIYKNECQNFSYTQSSKMYNRKRCEILDLLQELENIRVQYGINNTETISMKDNINEILKDLTIKTQDNDLSNQYLERIQKIDNEITKITKANMNDSDKLRRFNEYKKEINSITTSDDEVLCEKQEILNKIRKQEQYLNTTNEKQESTICKTDQIYEKERTRDDVNIKNKYKGHLKNVNVEKTESSERKYDNKIEDFIENFIYSQAVKEYMLEQDKIYDLLRKSKKGTSKHTETEVIEMTNADMEEKIISIDISNELCEIKRTSSEKVANQKQKVETHRNHSGISKTAFVSMKMSNKEQDDLK